MNTGLSSIAFPGVPFLLKQFILYFSMSILLPLLLDLRNLKPTEGTWQKWLEVRLILITEQSDGKMVD